jgi:hypothetical protein
MALTVRDVKVRGASGVVLLTWAYDAPDRPGDLYFELKAEVWAAPTIATLRSSWARG